MKIALLGLGTVGSGVLQVIQMNRDAIESRINQSLDVTHVYTRSLKNRHQVDLTGIEHTNQIDDILNSDVDLIVEVMGGVDVSYDIIKKALTKGIHVVTANKDMLALHIDELATLANDSKAQLAYEASCAGGIPIVQSLEHSLGANKITQMMGILNGTTNYILSRMTKDGWDYDRALKTAQEKGYAEADPTNDVEGFDAQRKIALLSRIAFEQQVNKEDIPVKGISEMDIIDIDIAKRAGFVFKLLGKGETAGDNLNISVAPTLLPINHQLAQVEDEMNAIFVQGNAVGDLMFYGPGAGGSETASAVVSDVMNIAKYGFIGNFVTTDQAQLTTDSKHSYYLRVGNLTDELKASDWIKTILSDNEHGTAIQTQQIAQDTLAKIKQEVSVQALYHLVSTY